VQICNSWTAPIRAIEAYTDIASLHGSSDQYLYEVASGLSAYADRQNLMWATRGRTFWGVVGLVQGSTFSGRWSSHVG